MKLDLEEIKPLMECECNSERKKEAKWTEYENIEEKLDLVVVCV